MNKISIFGLTITNGTSEEFIEYIFKNLEEGKKTHIITLNSLILLRSLFSPRLKNIIKNSELVFIESVGVELACKLIGFKVNKRIPGIDFFRELLYYIDIRFKSIYLLGASFDTITKAEKNIKKAFPSIKVIGRYHGYFKKDEEEKINIAIKKSSPDFIFVAMGSPKQEYWIASNLDKIKVAMGVGGSFDVFAGKRKRAPKKFINGGFEWLYRIVSHPTRIFQIFPLLLFCFITLNYALFIRIKKIFSKKNTKSEGKND
jgi:N-acetylglucosaminyldiphosphoundecaprenol N-acetyl-beta-D-mannosaminyltransferase